jgi:hypothetical protein
MIRHSSAFAIAGMLLTASLAQAQVLEYSVQTYAPLPRYGPANSSHEWVPRGILPDGTLVVNTFWSTSDPEDDRAAVALVTSTTSTALVDSLGNRVTHASVMAVESTGRLHMVGRTNTIDDTYLVWHNGTLSSQQDGLGVSHFWVEAASSQGHILGYNNDGLVRRWTVIRNGIQSEMPQIGFSRWFDGGAAVNGQGHVAGSSLNDSTAIAFVWDGSSVRLLASPPEFSQPSTTSVFGPTAINDVGLVAGVFGISGPAGSSQYSLLWNGDQLVTLPLRSDWRAFPQLDNLGTLLSADDTSPYLWRDGQLVRMTDLALPSFAGTLVSLDRLEPDGRVIGQAILDGQRVAVVLTPVPGPGGTVLGAIGLLIAARRARR